MQIYKSSIYTTHPTHPINLQSLYLLYYHIFFVFHLLSLLTLCINSLLSMCSNIGNGDRSDRKIKGTLSLWFDPMNEYRCICICKYPNLVFRFYQRALYSYCCFSSLYGYIYKIKLYICLRNTHDIGVCGH